jgi:superfamily I DNA/RNA helicase/RecB family exonuclease
MITPKPPAVGAAKFLPTPAFEVSGPIEFVGGQAVASFAHAPGRVVEVYGAPGTGKTSVLIQRFVDLVRRHGVAPEQILVLAATRESAARLRDALALALGRNAEGVDSDSAVEGSLARTASSVAFSVVRAHALANGLRAPELISGAEQDRIFTRLLHEHEFTQEVGSWPAHINQVTRGLAGFRAELRDLIAACQELGLDSAALFELDRAHPEWAAASHVFYMYEQLLLTPEFEGRFDAPSLVNRAVELLAENPIHSLHDFKTILIDDAQELTPSVARLIKAMVGPLTGLGVFGDPDSSTLGFRQADPRIMTQLAREVAAARGGESQVVPFVDDPWGKPAGLGRVMNRVSGLIAAEGAGGQRQVHLKSWAAEAPTESQLEVGGGPVENLVVKVFTNGQGELDWIANQLRRLHLEKGVAWNQIAIVARTRGVLEQLERALAAESVPVRIVGAQTALRDEFAARELLEVAVVACTGRMVTPETAERLLTSPYCGLDTIGMRRLRKNLRREAAAGEADSGSTTGEESQDAESYVASPMLLNSDDLLVDLFANPNSAETLRGPEARKVRKFLKDLEVARGIAKDSNQSIEDLLWHIWDSSKLAVRWSELSRGIGEVAVQANRNLDAVVSLFAAANRFVERNPGLRSGGESKSSGQDKLAFIAAQLDQALPEDSLSFKYQPGQTVDLLTPAGLVGRRYHTVVIPQLIEGIWPNLKPRSSLLGAGLLAAKVQGRLDESGKQIRQEMTDELRMFYKAMGSANHQVFVTSYVDPDEQISQFINLAAKQTPEPEEFYSHSLTLRGLVGKYRRQLASIPADSQNQQDLQKRAELAANLARLAEAGVPGAHPDQWYGIAPISSTQPLFEFTTDSERIPIYPSQLEAFVTCPLHWFLGSHGANEGDFSASVGILVHSAMELAGEKGEAAMWREVESKWHTLRFESAWLEQAERRKAKRLVRNLSSYLGKFAAEGGKVLAAEAKFEFELGKARISGKVDRIEQTADGKVVIVDLKTGKSLPSIPEGQQNPQLGLYQLAYTHGELAKLVPVDSTDAALGGAKLLFVSGENPVLRLQDSIEGNPEAAAYFEGIIANAAQGMAMPNNVFVAAVSSHCDNESSYGSCMLHLTKAVSFNG